MMYYKLLFIAILAMTVLSCASDTELHKEMDENGHLLEEYTRSVKDLKKQGLYKKYYPEGGPTMEIAHFVNDTLDGEFVRFERNGDTLSVAMMKAGKYEGYFREYYPNNKIKQSYQHVDGKITGLFKEYYESGALKGNITFLNNKEEGPFVEYHENGKKSFQGVYQGGEEVGELLKYDENGELIRKMDCKIVSSAGVAASICTTIWKKEGVED